MVQYFLYLDSISPQRQNDTLIQIISRTSLHKLFQAVFFQNLPLSYRRNPASGPSKSLASLGLGCLWLRGKLFYIMRPASVCVQPFLKSGEKLFFSLVLNLFKLVLCLKPSERHLGRVLGAFALVSHCASF